MVIAGLVGLLLLPAVAAQETSRPSAADDDVEVLRQRAAQFWAARVNRDFRKQWELMEPRIRGRMSENDFAAGRGRIRYLAYQVEQASTQGSFATVKVRVMAHPEVGAGSPRRVSPRVVLLDDPWIKIDGVWFHRQVETDAGPSLPASP
jgi:hypothetical protein